MLLRKNRQLRIENDIIKGKPLGADNLDPKSETKTTHSKIFRPRTDYRKCIMVKLASLMTTLNGSVVYVS